MDGYLRWYCVPSSLTTYSFDVPGELWQLSRRPSGLLPALGEIIETITHQLFSAQVVSQLSNSGETSLAVGVLRHATDVTVTLARIAG